MIKKVFCLFLLAVVATVTAKEVLIDEKAIAIPLPVGKEISIVFPKMVTKTEPADDGDSKNLDKLSQLLRPDGVLLLEAGEPFDKTRLIATMVDNSIVVLDLTAKIGAVNHEVIKLIEPKIVNSVMSKTKRIVNSQKKKENPNKPNFLRDGVAKSKNIERQDGITQVGFNDMVQFAFRHYVGPSRLVGRMKAKKVRVSSRGVNHFVRMWGNRLAIKPLRQWKINNQYVTVLLVNNKSSLPVSFDPRALRGRLLFAAALYPVIRPRGSINDQTLWAVVTAVPFNKAIQ